MNAYQLVAMWTEDRVRDLRRAADKADLAFTKEPMSRACKEYATALRAAADLLDEHKVAFDAVAMGLAIDESKP